MTETYDAGIKIRSSRRHAGNVKRYHAWPTIQQQTNADHTYHVLRIYMELFGCPVEDVLDYIMRHDLGEITSGDTPFPAKLTVPGLKEATLGAEQQGLELLGYETPALLPVEQWRVKICDMLEMLEFSQVEVGLGNSYALMIDRNIRHYLEKHLDKGQFCSGHVTMAVNNWIEIRIC